MVTLARAVEQEVFDRERVRITLSVAEHTVVPNRYVQMFPHPLPDTATLDELCARVNACLGDILYAVVNPLGSPAKISRSTSLASLRAYYAPPEPPVCRGLKRLFGSKVAQRFRHLGKAIRAL